MNAVAVEGGKRALVRTRSRSRPLAELSMERASEPKHPLETPGRPTMLIVPAMRPLSSPNLSISQRRLPAAVP